MMYMNFMKMRLSIRTMLITPRHPKKKVYKLSHGYQLVQHKVNKSKEGSKCFDAMQTPTEEEMTISAHALHTADLGLISLLGAVGNGSGGSSSVRRV